MQFRTFLENYTNTPADDVQARYTDWKEHKEEAKLFQKLSPYNIFKYRDLFFLIKDDKYIAHIQNYDDRIQEKTIDTVESFSTEREAYKILLLGLLKSPKIKRILTDSMLSSSATKFWKKMIQDPKIKKIIVDNQSKEIDTTEYLKYLEDPDYRIGITK